LITNITGYHSGRYSGGYFNRGTPCGRCQSKSGIDFITITMDNRNYVIYVSDLEEFVDDVGVEETDGRTPEDT